MDDFLLQTALLSILAGIGAFGLAKYLGERERRQRNKAPHQQGEVARRLRNVRRKRAAP